MGVDSTRSVAPSYDESVTNAVPLPGDHEPIAGPVLRFRPIAEADLPGLFRWRTDPGVAQFYGEPPKSAESLREYLEGNVNPVWRFIIESASGDVGHIQYYHDYPGDDFSWSAGIDIYIGEARDRERGVGTEAVRTMLQYLFESKGLHIVTIDPEVDNKRAIRCYERAGFRLDGVLRHHARERGQFLDTYFMSILEDEWPAAREAWLLTADR